MIAEVEEAQAFGKRCAAEAERRGVSAEDVNVLGDGAEWIGNGADQHLAGAAQVLDVYHGGEQLAKAGRAVFGEGGELARWLAPAREKMIADG